MKTKLSGFMALAALAAAMASTANAAESCLGPSGTGISNVLSIAAAGGCSVPGSTLVFNNFAVDPSAGFTAATVGISGPAFGTGVIGSDVDLGFQIGGILGSGAPNDGDIALEYTVSGGIIGLDLSVQATPIPTLGGGSLTVTEEACSVAWAGSVCNGITLANFSVTSFGGAAQKTQLFTTPYSGEVFLLKDLSYDGATTSSFVNSQIISSAPEPMTLSLMGVGLLGLGLVGRRVRK
jgi:hypothetical protein